MLNGDGNENGKSNEQKKKQQQQQQRRQQLCTSSTLALACLPSLNNSRFLHNRNRRM